MPGAFPHNVYSVGNDPRVSLKFTKPHCTNNPDFVTFKFKSAQSATAAKSKRPEIRRIRDKKGQRATTKKS